jgi:phosphoglycolate phosphatase
MPGYKLIVWDFDGTLADSLACSLRIYNGLARKHGFRPVEEPEAARGLSMLQFLRHHGISLRKLPALMREFLAIQRNEAASIELCAGVAEVLPQLRDTGTPMVVLSSNSAENISACLQANGVGDFFDSVVGYGKLFGKGRALRRLIRARRLKGSDVLYVGDELRDIEAARQAGAAVVAVTWGMNNRAALQRLNPHYLIDTPQELLALLDEDLP